jgi:hypothetical protein
MKKQKNQNAAPIIPVYDEDNLPDELFYPEGLDNPNGPNAGAMRATAIGEIIEPAKDFDDNEPECEMESGDLPVALGEIIEPEAECASQVSQAKAYDVLPEELDTAETEMPDTQEASVPLWDLLPEEVDSSEQTTGWTPREGAKLEVEYLD